MMACEVFRTKNEDGEEKIYIESELQGQFIGLLNNRNRRDSPKESFGPLMLILHFIVTVFKGRRTGKKIFQSFNFRIFQSSNPLIQLQ
jgi:hypothetical protein